MKHNYILTKAPLKDRYNEPIAVTGSTQFLTIRDQLQGDVNIYLSQIIGKGPPNWMGSREKVLCMLRDHPP